MHGLYTTLQIIAITGTVYHPEQYEQRFEAIDALLSLFDLQEKVQIQQLLSLTSEEGSSGLGMLDEIKSYAPQNNMQILLKSVIQDTCNYVRY